MEGPGTFKLKTALFGALLALLPTHCFAQEKVSLAVDWILNGTHAGYFIAQEKGFYKEKGLDVSIARGFGSGDTIKRVATGSVDFGVADTGAVIAARANDDIPVRIVAMVYDKATLGLIYLKQSGITKPKDLEGRTIARSASGASVNMFPGFLAANDVKREKIKEIVVDAATYLPLLISGQAEAVTEQAINIGKFSREAEKQGKQAVAMLYSDFGLATYGNAILVKDKRVTDNPDLIRRFTEASLRGLAYSLEHPEEAVDVLRKNNPEIDRNGALDELAAFKSIQATDDVRKHGFGYIDEQRLTETRDIVTNALSLKRTVKIEDIYSKGFLPETH
jgi:NitT/TauT family transport system substrate-binding protein